MRPEKAEWASLAVALLAVAGMAGFFLGGRSGAGPVIVSARTAPALTQSEAPAEPSAGAEEADGTQAAVAFPVNINTATVEELQALPGIGAARAQAIVDDREERGPFTYVEDLRRVSGIGESILAGLIDYITVGEASDG